jgi:hypothetical protein
MSIIRRDVKELKISLKHDLTIRFGGMLTVAVAEIIMLEKLL